jgi:restriction system protein
MSEQHSVWGVHMPERVGARAIEENYVAIGWPVLGDLRVYKDREALKKALPEYYPNEKAGSWRVSAGVLFRFAYEMKSGDIVVYPSKHDRMVNIGRFTGDYEYALNEPSEYPNRRRVEWLGHFSRTDFSQSALNTIGTFITVSLIKENASEFLAKVGVLSSDNKSMSYASVAEEGGDDDTATDEVTKQAEVTAGDFIIRQLMTKMSGYAFEELVAHLLECMGYTARVTQRSGDGGVDVIAHRDKLGFEPPIIKVQCKRKTDPVPNTEVNQLHGTLGEGEYGLFISLGSFTRQARELASTRPKLRLIEGTQFVELLMEHYNQLSPSYRSLIPLKQIYVPDLGNTPSPS